MTESEKNDLLVELSIQTKAIAEVLPEIRDTLKEHERKIAEHSWSLAQGTDAFAHQRKLISDNDVSHKAELAAMKKELKEEYVRKEIMRAYLIGASLGSAVGGGGLVVGLLKLFGG